MLSVSRRGAAPETPTAISCPVAGSQIVAADEAFFTSGKPEEALPFVILSIFVAFRRGRVDLGAR